MRYHSTRFPLFSFFLFYIPLRPQITLQSSQNFSPIRIPRKFRNIFIEILASPSHFSIHVTKTKILYCYTAPGEYIKKNIFHVTSLPRMSPRISMEFCNKNTVKTISKQLKIPVSFTATFTSSI